MKHHVVAAIAAAALVAVASPALASTADATLSNFQIHLVDLNTSDGIAPSVVFQNFQGGSFVAAESGTSTNHFTDVHAGGIPFGDAASTSVLGTASGEASLSGDPFGAGGTVRASATASQLGTFGASTVWLGDGNNYVSFTLSADTRLVISGDASVSVMSTIDDPSADAWASVFLKLTDYTGVDNASTGGAVAEQFSTFGGTPFPTTDARHVEISFDNLDTRSADGIFFGSVDASTSSLSTVPEPAGLAMFGLAALGLVGLRRRQPR
ncbi:MAG: PEP-CTERM sorting domain-containing protein [Ramlibacter sp.]